MSSENSNSNISSNSDSASIRLDNFLKFTGLAETGGHAKLLIQDGAVEVNGKVETRRRRKLTLKDVVTIGDDTFKISDYFEEDSEDVC